eukprot:SAG11_NODE_4676_length_1810_cov_1.639392_1_plen_87_part_00
MKAVKDANTESNQESRQSSEQPKINARTARIVEEVGKVAVQMLVLRAARQHKVSADALKAEILRAKYCFDHRENWWRVNQQRLQYV